jgi:hypothetical protein
MTCSNRLDRGPTIVLYLQLVRGGQKALEAFRVQNRLVLSFLGFWVHVSTCAIVYYDEVNNTPRIGCVESGTLLSYCSVNKRSLAPRGITAHQVNPDLSKSGFKRSEQ